MTEPFFRRQVKFPNLTGQQFGSYRLEAPLGAGIFAAVYLGQHIHLQRQAAIKVLHEFVLREVGIEKLRHEADILINLAHPHIVKVLDFDIKDNIPFLVMDYLHRSSLRNYYSRGTILPLTTISLYVKQIASALQYAHNQNIIHQDVKPGTIFLADSNDVLLASFGFSSPIKNIGRASPLIETPGTPSYTAPEQWEMEPCPASDQYSLAICVYEWLCGKRPFEYNALPSIKEQHLNLPPPSLREQVPTITEKVEKVVLKALAKDSANRFASITDFSDAFEQAASLPRIFVSHSSKDNDFGIRLVHDLRKELGGNDDAVWYDSYGGLQGGMSWWNTIKQELRTRDIFLVVLSPDAIESKWVNDEIAMAWSLRNSMGKRIIPLRYRNCNVDIDLNTLQIISFVEPKPYEIAFNELLNALGLSNSLQL